jgi:chitodextrinase
MASRHARRIAAGTMALGLVLASTLGATTASAGRDRTPPTTPTNLRVIGTTPYSVSLAWNASTDKSGIGSYTICCAYTNSATVSGSVTSFTFTAGIEASRPFSFNVTARDNAGNYSQPSNSVSVTTPADATPPTKPTVSVTDVGPTHVSLAWSSVEDGPNVWFSVFMDGTRVLNGTRSTSVTFSPLEPATTHTFSVQAQDFAHNLSPLSDPVTVTTQARDTGDATPPTAPGNLRTNGMQFGDGETWLFWDQSTDDQTPQSLIEYRVFLNGVYDHSVVGRGDTVLYGNPGAQNTFTIIAMDESANESSPATLVVDNF